MVRGATVMITGASSGIGAACARAFADAGARLVLSARRQERLAAVADGLDADCHLLPLDVRDRDGVAAAVDGLGAGWSSIDVLVNNAGLAAGFEPILDGDPDDWDRMLDTNVRGLLDVTRAVVPGMVARGHGHVVNIGSIAGRETYANGAVYCASKAAVDRITRGLRLELVGSGVKVSTVDPGLVDTEFSTVRFHGDAEKADAVYEGLEPLTAEDIAETVLWVVDRPPHVQITEVVIFPTAQAAATTVARRADAPPPRD